MIYNFFVFGVCCIVYIGFFSIFFGDIVVLLDGEFIFDIDMFVVIVKWILGKLNFNIGFIWFELFGCNFYDIIYVSNKYFFDFVEMKLNGKICEWDKSIFFLMLELCFFCVEFF